MKKFYLFALAMLAAGTLQAFDQSAYAPGVFLSSVPGTKLAEDSFLAARPGKPFSGIIDLIKNLSKGYRQRVGFPPRTGQKRC